MYPLLIAEVSVGVMSAAQRLKCQFREMWHNPLHQLMVRTPGQRSQCGLGVFTGAHTSTQQLQQCMEWKQLSKLCVRRGNLPRTSSRGINHGRPAICESLLRLCMLHDSTSHSTEIHPESLHFVYKTPVEVMSVWHNNNL